MFDDILTTIPKSIVSVVILFILARIMGKKQLSQLTYFDYVVGISIGSIAAAFAVDSSINYAKGITGLIIYALFPIILSLISLKNYKARKLLDGKPTILINNGQIIEENLKKTKLTVNDVLEECRLKNVFNLVDVEFAVLETSGKVSVQLKSSCQPLTPKDMNIQTAYKGLCLNVIIDGTILDDYLQMNDKNRMWLQEELKKQGVLDLKDVLLAYIDSNNQLVVQKKSNSNTTNTLI
ncbi:MAG: DUF421 domain-containing protein [Oscillospiraceae bacterium]|nr:DUF421 domain-containing protein [Oscillospiraceae bacterium]